MRFRAPATSANLGPGFDCAACAFELWNELELSDGSGVTIEGEGTDELAADPTNLAVRAYALLADPAGKQFHFVNRIPLERGLGSSAAAIALGLTAARPGAPLAELIEAGLELEDHADNLAAALVGGVTLAWGGSATRIADRLPLEAIAVIPRARTSTRESRTCLPASISHADAAATAGRAAMLGASAVSGDIDLFVKALGDHLHEPYRPSAVLEDVRAQPPTGARGATLSGSGPTVIVWAEAVEPSAAELRSRFTDHDVLPLAIATRGSL